MRSFFGRQTASRVRQGYQGPADTIVYAIGDVHGCLAELELLLERIAADISMAGKAAHLIFLGDYVDRGPDSAGVLARLVEKPLIGSRHSFLLGNHEEVMLAVVDGLTSLRNWLLYGGMQTLESYGISRADVLRFGSDLPRYMQTVIPEEHLHFLRTCEDLIQAADYVFVHAGIRAGIPLAEQDPSDLRWIREDFLSNTTSDHGAMVVHGHTISPQPMIMRNRIGIDTGCYKTGQLTALVVDGRETRFITTGLDK